MSSLWLLQTVGVCWAYLRHDAGEEERHAIAWVIRDRSDKQVPIDDIQELVRQGLSREPTPSGKARFLLLELKQRSRAFGREAIFHAVTEWPLVKARREEECEAIIAALKEEGFLVDSPGLPSNSHVLTWKAWEELAPLHGVASKTVFVAMAFRD